MAITTLSRAQAAGKHRKKDEPTPKRQRVRLHQDKTRKAPPAQHGQPAGHKAYARTHDEHGHEVPDWTNWRTCDCEIGVNHLD